MRIAICDDEPTFRDKLKRAINTYDGLPKDVHVNVFPNGQSLIDSHEQSPYNIIFLDVEMPGTNGMETARVIRSIDRKVKIIIVTSYSEFVWQSFKVEVFDYITKPYDSVDIHDVLRRAINKNTDQHFKLELKSKENTIIANVGDIVYIEIEKRQLKFVTQYSEYICAGKLDYYDDLLSPHGFFRCHKSFLINMEFIRTIKENVITTVSGNEVDFSTRKKKEFNKMLNEYLARYRI